MLLIMGDFNAKVGSREPSAMSSAAHRLGSLPAGMLAANVAARQLPMPAVADIYQPGLPLLPLMLQRIRRLRRLDLRRLKP